MCLTYCAFYGVWMWNCMFLSPSPCAVSMYILAWKFLCVLQIIIHSVIHQCWLFSLSLSNCSALYVILVFQLFSLDNTLTCLLFIFSYPVTLSLISYHLILRWVTGWWCWRCDQASEAGDISDTQNWRVLWPLTTFLKCQYGRWPFCFAFLGLFFSGSGRRICFDCWNLLKLLTRNGETPQNVGLTLDFVVVFWPIGKITSSFHSGFDLFWSITCSGSVWLFALYSANFTS